MTDQTGPRLDARERRTVVAVAWVAILALSLGPRVVLQELFRLQPSADLLAAASIGLMGLALVATAWWAPGRALRPFIAVMAVLVASRWLVLTRLDEAAPIAAALRDPAFGVRLLTEMLLNLVVTGLMLATLWTIHRGRRRDFYLAKGDTAAPAGAVRWMGISAGDPWTGVGRVLSVAITLGTVAFLVLAGGPSLEQFARVGPLVPVVLAAAALNAFNEEVTYKASILSVLAGPVGGRDALRMVAAYFGIAHFYGVPYGIVGVALAWFLGWILAKSMLETRGIAWAWFIHFLQDVAIFGFMAVGAITPGG